MRVVIESPVANDEAEHAWLVRIQHTFEDGWHLWSVDIDDLEKLSSSSWLKDPGHAGKSASEILRSSFTRSAYPSKLHQKVVRISAEPQEYPLTFAPKAASHFLMQELTLLVEERESDGDFLKIVIRELGDDELKKHLFELERPAWRLDSRGGKSKMQDEIKRASASPVLPRLMVLCDSDRCSPSSAETEDVRSLREACASAGVPCWILQKREMENYLPACLLEHRTKPGQPLTHVFAAWCRLDERQKDFLDLKEGLKTKKGRPIDRDYEDMLSNLSTEDRAVLERGGFGSKVGSDLWGQAWKGKAQVTALDLQERDHKGELGRLLDELRKQL